MNPETPGCSPVRPVRIPEDLWKRLTNWAQRSGVGNSEALRQLLHAGLETEPSEIQAITDRSKNFRSLVHPGEGLIAWVPSGPDWWDLDDLLGQITGARRADGSVAQTPRYAFPQSSLALIRAVFADRPDRVRVYRTLHYTE